MSIILPNRERVLEEVRRAGVNPAEVVADSLTEDGYLALVPVPQPNGRMWMMRESRDWPSETAGRRIMAALRGELEPELRILVIDAGLATGWSTWTLAEDRPIERVRYGLIPEGLEGFLAQLPTRPWGKVRLVICERYVPGGDVVFPEIDGVRIEGAVALWAAQRGIEVVWQERTMKRQVRDEILREHGLWLTGKDPAVRWKDGRDVNDTALHALAYAKTQEHRPTVERFWPDAD